VCPSRFQENATAAPGLSRCAFASVRQESRALSASSAARRVETVPFQDLGGRTVLHSLYILKDLSSHCVHFLQDMSTTAGNFEEEIRAEGIELAAVEETFKPAWWPEWLKKLADDLGPFHPKVTQLLASSTRLSLHRPSRPRLQLL